MEFHNFASLGDTDRAIAHYLDENSRRAAIIQAHREFIGPMTPFLEIGANAGHTSYMLANQFAGEGFALDISADALRHGVALMDRWQLSRAPVRLAGDAVNLPFRDGSIQFVMACQMLSQFMNIESVFLEVKRVLAPGGVFLFTEEPLRRLLSLRIYRVPYQDRMKPWERKLFDWGLLGYLARDVIGAEQEESFGIRQNHKMYLSDWHRLIAKHFAEHRYQTFVPERGWGERIVKRAALNRLARRATARRHPGRHVQESGLVRATPSHSSVSKPCSAARIATAILTRDADGHPGLRLRLSRAQRGRSLQFAARRPARRTLSRRPPDVIDFSLPSHTGRLGDGWYELEGDYGNKYRWIGAPGLRRAPPRSSWPAAVAHSWLCARNPVHERPAGGRNPGQRCARGTATA